MLLTVGSRQQLIGSVPNAAGIASGSQLVLERCAEICSAIEGRIQARFTVRVDGAARRIYSDGVILRSAATKDLCISVLNVISLELHVEPVVPVRK